MDFLCVTQEVPMTEAERLRKVLVDLRARLIEVNEGGEMGGIDSELVATIDCALAVPSVQQPKPPHEREPPHCPSCSCGMGNAEYLCPHPVTGRPDNMTMAECILAGECGCTKAAVAARAAANQRESQ